MVAPRTRGTDRGTPSSPTARCGGREWRTSNTAVSENSTWRNEYSAAVARLGVAGLERPGQARQPPGHELPQQARHPICPSLGGVGVLAGQQAVVERDEADASVGADPLVLWGRRGSTESRSQLPCGPSQILHSDSRQRETCWKSEDFLDGAGETSEGVHLRQLRFRQRREPAGPSRNERTSAFALGACDLSAAYRRVEYKAYAINTTTPKATTPSLMASIFRLVGSSGPSAMWILS